LVTAQGNNKRKIGVGYCELGVCYVGFLNEDDVCCSAGAIEEGIYHNGTSIYIMGDYADGFCQWVVVMH
jgi:hypothetical protein